jgi:16S rRNA (uracil1498-N3)-methyltransferase
MAKRPLDRSSLRQEEPFVSDYDFTAQRLFLDTPLIAGMTCDAPATVHNYLLNVLRLRAGDVIHVFNGRDGEFRARLTEASRRLVRFGIEAQLRPQTELADLDYAFAPLKQARLDYMIQKAVEMGAGRLTPVITNRTQVRRLNLERLRANVIEAAEQCGVLAIPGIVEPVGLSTYLAGLPAARLLVFCDERAPVGNPIEALGAMADRGGAGISVIVGPEGGFDDGERALLLRGRNVARISLGSRILRADTAAIAALALVQAALGDGL